MTWYVAMRNDVGQASITEFDTEQEFKEYYRGKMEDGSGKLIRTIYPTILYQGENKHVCQRACGEDFERMMRDPKRVLTAMKAEGAGAAGMLENIIETRRR